MIFERKITPLNYHSLCIFFLQKAQVRKCCPKNYCWTKPLWLTNCDTHLLFQALMKFYHFLLIIVHTEYYEYW